jgi:hypothetical protein
MYVIFTSGEKNGDLKAGLLPSTSDRESITIRYHYYYVVHSIDKSKTCEIMEVEKVNDQDSIGGIYEPKKNHFPSKAWRCIDKAAYEFRLRIPLYP